MIGMTAEQILEDRLDVLERAHAVLHGAFQSACVQLIACLLKRTVTDADPAVQELQSRLLDEQATE